MIEPLKLLFDENFGRPLVVQFAALKVLTQPDLVLRHFLDLYPMGTLDSDWIPRAGRDGFIIITQDRGRQGKRTEKLPMLCARHRVTHVLVSQRIKADGQDMQISAIHAVWPDLLLLPSKTRGSRHLIKYGSSRKPILVELEVPGPAQAW